MSHIAPKSLYYTIFGSLMVLTAVTVAVAFMNLGVLNFPVAIGIAVSKATLVILFFMHVKYGSKMTKLVVGSVLFFMAALFGFFLTDYSSRGWFVSPRGSATAGTAVTVGANPASVGAILPAGAAPADGAPAAEPAH